MINPNEMDINIYRMFCKKTFGTSYLLELVSKLNCEGFIITDDIIKPNEVVDHILGMISLGYTHIPKCINDIITHNYIIRYNPQHCAIEYSNGITYVDTTFKFGKNQGICIK